MYRIAAVLLLLAGCAAPQRPAPSATRLSESEAAAAAVVQAQLEAYNRHDVDAFAATYAPDVRIYDHPDKLQVSGIDQLRRSYGEFFAAAPNVHATVSTRIVQGEYVIDRETASNLPGGAQIKAVAVYQVKGGRIQNVWFLQ